MLIFTSLCLGVGGLSESLSLRTGLPFGSYYFTEVMGPKFSGLPILLVLAYLGMAYCSWVMSLLIIGYRKPVRGLRTVMIPLLASLVCWLGTFRWKRIGPRWMSLDMA